MKTIKITEEAHKNLIKTQAEIYELTGKKWTISKILENFFLGGYRNNNDQSKK